MLDFAPNILPNQRELDDAHERGFRAFLAHIRHNSASSVHRGNASNSLVELMDGVRGRGPDPNYGEPLVAGSYIVRYHLSHCALAYWAFNLLFERVGVPETLYVCDVGAGTGASRVGLLLALNEHPNNVEVYFDAYEPSATMMRAGNCFWEALRDALVVKHPIKYRESQTCPTKLPRLSDNAIRVVTAFHLSLPYNSGLGIHPFMYRYGKSRSLSPAQQSLQSALNFVKPNAGIFTCHTNKENSLRQAVDSFPGWNGKAAPITIPKDDGVGSRSGFYTNCAENFGFTVPESDAYPSPVRTWSRFRFSLPDGVLLLSTAPSREELQLREQERSAVEGRRRQEEERLEAQKKEEECQRRIEAECKAAEVERKRQELLESQRIAAAQRAEEERRRKEAIDQLWATLDSCRESGEVVSAEVAGTNSGGLLVKWEGLRGFVPFSHCRDIANRDDADALEELRGQSYEFNVLETDRPKGDFKLTRRHIIERAAWESLSDGQVLDGVVVGVANFGVFVWITENIEGLIHISELSNGRVNRVTDVVSVGQQVKVLVLGVDVEKKRLSLSIRAAFEKQWDGLEELLPVGHERNGKVKRIEANKRLVVDIGDDLEGRIHVSQLDGRRPEDFQPGDKVRVTILRIDSRNRLIWLRLTEGGPVSKEAS